VGPGRTFQNKKRLSEVFGRQLSWDAKRLVLSDIQQNMVQFSPSRVEIHTHDFSDDAENDTLLLIPEEDGSMIHDDG
jgi:hypothetical protein